MQTPKAFVEPAPTKLKEQQAVTIMGINNTKGKKKKKARRRKRGPMPGTSDLLKLSGLKITTIIQSLRTVRDF